MVYITRLLCSTIKYTISLQCTLSLNGQHKQIREAARDNELEKLLRVSEAAGKIQGVLSSHLKQKHFKLRNSKCFFFLHPLSVDMFEYRSVYVMGAREIGNTTLLSRITTKTLF